jgi:hypothetical protein
MNTVFMGHCAVRHNEHKNDVIAYNAHMRQGGSVVGLSQLCHLTCAACLAFRSPVRSRVRPRCSSFNTRAMDEPTSMASYLEGCWGLNKHIDYGDYGGRAKFSGTARFVRVAETTLWYKEEGALVLQTGTVCS